MDLLVTDAQCEQVTERDQKVMAIVRGYMHGYGAHEADLGNALCMSRVTHRTMSLVNLGEVVGIVELALIKLDRNRRVIL